MFARLSCRKPLYSPSFGNTNRAFVSKDCLAESLRQRAGRLDIAFLEL